MALNSNNVLVGITGSVRFAPTGTTEPSTSESVLPGTWRDVGYIGEDGVTEAYDSDSTEITAWQGGTVVRTINSSQATTLQFRMIETNKNSLELFHPGSTVTTDGSSGWKLDVTSDTGQRRMFVLDVLDGSKHLRIIVPNGQVTERGEIQYVNDDAVGYEVTITAYPVDMGGGVSRTMTKLSNDDAWNAS